MVHGLLSRTAQARPDDSQAPVAQGKEHPPSKRGVAGSNPAGGALFALAALALAVAGCDPAQCRNMCAPHPVERLTFTSCVCAVAQPDGGR